MLLIRNEMVHNFKELTASIIFNFSPHEQRFHFHVCEKYCNFVGMKRIQKSEDLRLEFKNGF